ncbi:hypothetical protein SSX86_026917 [Deinandra increscens subsp. villosa]|uniref:Transferase, Chloramphenicol acetyltransferase-like domain protein n=1 Tax=Deinandra increscens subsp. villosa TaxID=3103831 RepID=A0AAP0CKI7_9ASTR
MTTTTDGRLTVFEKCRISPPPNTVGERSLPLTFFDLIWLLAPPLHQIFFYDFPHSKSHFIDEIIPKLKHSLSLTLQHFFPFASNLTVFPAKNNSSGLVRKPEIRYVEGDSVPITFAEECDLDFNYLKGNHPRDCNKFHGLVPVLESPYRVSDDVVKIPVFSIQVTIFENTGITIGLTNHHSLCDARTDYDFLMAWTSIAKHGTVAIGRSLLPFYDRVIEYPDSLDDPWLNLPAVRTMDESYKVPELVPQADRVRSTIVLRRSQINTLKKWVLLQLPTMEYVSSFAIGCGYVWSCIAKSRVHVLGEKGEYDVEGFRCAADWRDRFGVSQMYFGNCVGPSCRATTKTTLITESKEGFLRAVELVSMAIREGVNGKNQDHVFKDAETWLEKMSRQVPTVGVAGTPKSNIYDVDFGWGKPEKYEIISLDFSDLISVNAGKESVGDLEIGLCLPAEQMDAFINISRNELENILSHDF